MEGQSLLGFCCRMSLKKMCQPRYSFPSGLLVFALSPRDFFLLVPSFISLQKRGWLGTSRWCAPRARDGGKVGSGRQKKYWRGTEVVSSFCCFILFVYCIATFKNGFLISVKTPVILNCLALPSLIVNLLKFHSKSIGVFMFIVIIVWLLHTSFHGIW